MTQTLKSFPEIGKKVEEYKDDKSLRQLFYKTYRIIYRYADEEVEGFSDFMFAYFRPFYRLFVNYIPDGFRSIKWSFQRVFRKSRCADIDLWNLKLENIYHHGLEDKNC